MSKKGKILVTGGCGFIGSHTVVALMNQGYEPVIIDNFENSEKGVISGIQAITGKLPKWYEGDCTDLQTMNAIFEQEPNIEGVIHFAAYKAVGESVDEPLKYYRNNVGSLVAVIQMMEKHNVEHLVFSSSCTVYGEPKILPVTEEFPSVAANSPYGNTKQICEEIITDQVHAKGAKLNAVLLRYFNPIGAHPSSKIGELPIGVPNNLIPFITQTAAGKRDQLTIFGNDYNTSDGTCIRDYIHVMDLAEAHVASLEWLVSKNHQCEIFNLGSGSGNSVLEVVQLFEKISGQPLNYNIGPRRDGDVEQIYASAKKAENMLNWSTSRSLEDALRDAWKWQNQLAKD